MEPNSPVLTFALALAAGMIAQALARHLKIPGIVLLLLLGVVLGPDLLNVVRPDNLGRGLPAIVGAAVAVILFEGGLHLDVTRLRREAGVIRRLITVGAVVTAVGSTLAARAFLGWSWDLAVPFGTLVIVTGPTVITPLLRRIRVKRNLHTILEAEAVLIDPIGAILAVVALEVMLSQEIGAAARGLLDIPTRLLFGIVAGGMGGLLMAWALSSSKLLPDGLESVLTLSLVLALYALCDVVVPESGVMAAPVAGMVVGNVPSVPIRELKEFKEQLTVMLVALLFVLLAADVRIREVTELGWRGLATVLAVMVFVRPLAVALSTAGSTLSVQDKAFMAWLGPRGIVAAAVASFFAEELVSRGVPEGFELRALVFLVIATTVVIQGLGGRPIARLLGVHRPCTGYLIAGANPLARALGSALAAAGQEVVLVDTDRSEVAAANALGLTAVLGNALDDDILRTADLDGKEGVVSLIPNEAVGVLIAQKARREYRVRKAFVAIRPGRLGTSADRLRSLGAEVLFGGETDLGAALGALATGESDVARYRYLGSDRSTSPALDWPGATGVIPLVLERRGSVVPFGGELRLRLDDVVTLLSLYRTSSAGSDFQAVVSPS